MSIWLSVPLRSVSSMEYPGAGPPPLRMQEVGQRVDRGAQMLVGAGRQATMKYPAQNVVTQIRSSPMQILPKNPSSVRNVGRRRRLGRDINRIYFGEWEMVIYEKNSMDFYCSRHFMPYGDN